MKMLEGLTSTILNNGLEVWALPWRKNQASVWAAVKTGAAFEEEFTGYGLSHFLEHMLFNGCRDYPGDAYSRTVRQFGGYCNAYTSSNRTVYYQKLPPAYWRTGLAMLANMVRFPDLNEEPVVKERQVICRESELYNDRPDNKMLHRVYELLCPGSPAAHPVIGYPELIKEVTREMLVTYHRRRYSPHRSVVLAAADAEPEEIFAEAERCFGSWPRGGMREPEVHRSEPLTAAVRERIVYPDPMSRFYLGLRVPELNGRRRAALTLLLTALFNDSNALLVRDLVRKERMLHELGAFPIDLTEGEKLLIIGAAMIPEKLATGLNAFYRTLAGQLAAGIDRKFLQQVVQNEEIKQLQAASDPNMLERLALECALERRPDAVEEDLAQLRQVTADEVSELGRELLIPEHFAEVSQAVKPAAKKRAAAAETLWRESKLANGMKFLWAGGDPLVHVVLTLPGGALFENAGYPGLSEIWAGTLTGGAGKLDEEELLERLNRTGILHKISTGNNSAILEFSFLKNRAAAAVKLLRLLLTEPKFPAAVLDRERELLRHQLESDAVDAAELAEEVTRRAVFGDHQLGRTGKEIIAALDRITPEILQEFHRSMFTVRGVVIVAGNCTESSARNLAEELLAGISVMPDRAPDQPPPFVPAAPQVLHLDKERTQVEVGLRCPPYSEPRTKLALDILLKMENGLSSVLMKNIRDLNALSYSCSAGMTASLVPGMLKFMAATTRAGAEKALELIMEEIRRLGESGAGEAEFREAVTKLNVCKQQIRDSYCRLLAELGIMRFYDLPADELLRPCDDSFTLAEFNAILKQWFRREAAAAVTVIGDKQ